MAASFDGHTEIVQILLEAGVPINTQKEVFEQLRRLLFTYFNLIIL